MVIGQHNTEGFTIVSLKTPLYFRVMAAKTAFSNIKKDMCKHQNKGYRNRAEM